MVEKRPFPVPAAEGVRTCTAANTDGSYGSTEEDQLTLPPSQRRRPTLEIESQSWPNILEALTQRVLNECAARLEPLVRTAVREELQPLLTLLEARLHQSLGPAPVLHRSHAGTSGAKKFQLRFLNKVPKSIFTQTKIAAQDGTPLKVALFDTTSGRIVENDPLSRLKVELRVLCGDFGSNEDECLWTNHEFLASVVTGRPGKRPLLDGNPIIKLQGGVSEVGEIALTDNSKWMKNSMFKLGVIALGNEEIQVQGGISDPFRVKDRRGESYEKHYPPLLDDPLWRLENIARDGPYGKQLTVKDLLRLHVSNPSALDKIFEGISKKKQEAIMKHALTCVVDDSSSYLYQIADPPIALFFNCIYKLVKVTFDRQHFLSPEDLTSEQKVIVEMVKQQAYANLEAFVSVDQISTLSLLIPKELPLPGCSVMPGQNVQQTLIPFDHYGMQHNLNISSTSMAYPFLGAQDGFPFQSGEVPDSFFIDIEHWARMNDGTWPSCSQVPDVSLSSLVENSNQHYQMSNFFPATMGGDSSSHFPPFQAAELDVFPPYAGVNTHIVGTVALKSSLATILAVAKWVRSVRRNERTKAKLLCYNG